MLGETAIFSMIKILNRRIEMVDIDMFFFKKTFPISDPLEAFCSVYLFANFPLKKHEADNIMFRVNEMNDL